MLRTFAQYTVTDMLRSGDQHLELVQSFEARDPLWAQSVMAAHILAGRATFLCSRVMNERKVGRDEFPTIHGSRNIG